MNTAAFERRQIDLTVQGTALGIDTMSRRSEKAPVVFLHGFGSTKEDYADFFLLDAFADHGFCAYDAPGCGQSWCERPDRISIPFLVDVALGILETQGIDRFHVVGHSMGGLTALMLANAIPERVLSFASIEGNVAPEDCFLSRQIFEYPDSDDHAFFEAFIARAHASRTWSSPLYAASLAHKVRPEAVRGIFSSMVHLSDNGELMDRFLGLPCPRLFMYGDQNDHLSYLDHLRANGVRLACIDDCGHFPMYSNPTQMWRQLAAMVRDAESA